MGGDELSNLAGSGAGDVRCAVLPIAILLVRAVAGNGEGNHRAAVLGIARRHISRQVAHQQTFREVAVDIMLNSGCAQVVEVLLLPIFLIAAGLETPGNHNALTLGQLGTQVVADELSRRTDGNETGILVLPTVHGKPEAGVCVVASIEVLSICSKTADNNEIVDVSHNVCLLSRQFVIKKAGSPLLWKVCLTTNCEMYERGNAPK